MAMQAPNHLFRVLFLGIVSGAPSVAHAGAWIAENQTISSIAYGDRDEGRFGEADIFHERQIAEGSSIVAQSHADLASVYGSHGWRGEALIGGKWAPWRSANGAVALQAGGTWTYEPIAACEGLGARCARWPAELGARCLLTQRAPIEFEAQDAITDDLI
jgi:hypothetical protein